MSKKIDQVIDDIKQKAEYAAGKAEVKLDEKKDEWAELAAVDPTATRRRLRVFWICVAGGLGILLGAALHAAYIWLF